MNLIKHKIASLILPFCLILMPACSSSSDSIRYGSGKETKKEKEKPVRYGKIEAAENNYEDDPDETPDDLTTVDAPLLISSYGFNSGISNDVVTLKESILMEIIKYMNTPYKYGGNSKSGIDCSAFTQTVFESCSIKLLRSAKEQYSQGVPVVNKDELKFGDLVFFNTRKTVKPGHVGIYIGENLFVHASSKHGVIVTPLSHDYYESRYMGARRMEEFLNLQ